MTHSRPFLHAAWASVLIAAIASGCSANPAVAPGGPSPGAGTTSRNKVRLHALNIPANTQTYAGYVTAVNATFFTIDTSNTTEGSWTDKCGSFHVYYDGNTQFDLGQPIVNQWIQVTGVAINGTGSDDVCHGSAGTSGFSVNPSTYISTYPSAPPSVSAKGAVVSVNSDSFEMIANDAVTLVVLNSFESNVSPSIGQIATVTGFGTVGDDIHATSVSMASAPFVPIYWSAANNTDPNYVSVVNHYLNSNDYISYSIASDSTNYPNALTKVGGWSHVVNLPTTICPSGATSPPTVCGTQRADASAHSLQDVMYPSNCPGWSQAGVALYDDEQWPNGQNLTTPNEYSNFQTAVPEGKQLVPAQTCHSGSAPFATQYTYGSAVSGQLLGIGSCRLGSQPTISNWSVNIFDVQSQALMTTNPADTCQGSVVTWLNGTRILLKDAAANNSSAKLWAEASLEKTDPQTLVGAVASLLISTEPPNILYLAAAESSATCTDPASPTVTPNPAPTPIPNPTPTPCSFSSSSTSEPNLQTVMEGLGRTPSP